MQVTKIVKFASSHRLRDYQGKCQNLHGHNYEAHITYHGENLRGNGILIDFGEIKAGIGQWIDTWWDHATLVHPLDRSLIQFLEKEEQRYFVMPDHLGNSTAENMARMVMDQAELMIPFSERDQLKVFKVKIYETDSSYAEVINGL